MVNRGQELYCHECDGYVRFVIDDELDGNHEIECPKCGHIHYRVVKDGVITDVRYQPQYRTIRISYQNISWSSTSTYSYSYSSDSGSSSSATWSLWISAGT